MGRGERPSDSAVFLCTEAGIYALKESSATFLLDLRLG